MSLPLLKNGQCHWTLIDTILEFFKSFQYLIRKAQS
ncbi:hypothetical protein VagYM19_15990 [Vibrio alginolyticus]|nr:hypothetical protein Vag1382_15980 [Vibrio alginolyticus]BCB47072.1 hypothetical protein VagVIO5_15980 [Vibrio alginolyticus]BCB51673.1 hypothetical protein VagYM19_15990 [Vibrio alginolyticus]BCB56276.1 hypothetical protein VagYM4_15990 [Vibrio alginolyticus]